MKKAVLKQCLLLKEGLWNYNAYSKTSGVMKHHNTTSAVYTYNEPYSISAFLENRITSTNNQQNDGQDINILSPYFSNSIGYKDNLLLENMFSGNEEYDLDEKRTQTLNDILQSDPEEMSFSENKDIFSSCTPNFVNSPNLNLFKTCSQDNLSLKTNYEENSDYSALRATAFSQNNKTIPFHGNDIYSIFQHTPKLVQENSPVLKNHT